MAFFFLYFFVIKCPKRWAKKLASFLDKRFLNQEIFIIPEICTKFFFFSWENLQQKNLSLTVGNINSDFYKEI